MSQNTTKAVRRRLLRSDSGLEVFSFKGPYDYGKIVGEGEKEGWKMGEVFEPKDVLERRRFRKRFLRDLSPDLRRTVEEMLEKYEGKDLEKRLFELLGKEKTRRLLMSYK